MALQEIGPRFALKLRSLRAELPTVKESVKHSTQLEFYEFDDTAVDGEQPECEGSVPPSAEGPVKVGKKMMRRMGSRNPHRRKADHQRLLNTSGGGT